MKDKKSLHLVCRLFYNISGLIMQHCDFSDFSTLYLDKIFISGIYIEKYHMIKTLSISNSKFMSSKININNSQITCITISNCNSDFILNIKVINLKYLTLKGCLPKKILSDTIKQIIISDLNIYKFPKYKYESLRLSRNKICIYKIVLDQPKSNFYLHENTINESIKIVLKADINILSIRDNGIKYLNIKTNGYKINIFNLVEGLITKNIY